MNALALCEKDLAALRATFRRFPCVREVRVFGSRATGHARRASDLDLAIFAPDATAREWQELAEAMDAVPLIYELDLVRPEFTANARLLEKSRARAWRFSREARVRKTIVIPHAR